MVSNYYSPFYGQQQFYQLPNLYAARPGEELPRGRSRSCNDLNEVLNQPMQVPMQAPMQAPVQVPYQYGYYSLHMQPPVHSPHMPSPYMASPHIPYVPFGYSNQLVPDREMPAKSRSLSSGNIASKAKEASIEPFTGPARYRGRHQHSLSAPGQHTGFAQDSYSRQNRLSMYSNTSSSRESSIDTESLRTQSCTISSATSMHSTNSSIQEEDGKLAMKSVKVQTDFVEPSNNGSEAVKRSNLSKKQAAQESIRQVNQVIEERSDAKMMTAKAQTVGLINAQRDPSKVEQQFYGHQIKATVDDVPVTGSTMNSSRPIDTPAIHSELRFPVGPSTPPPESSTLTPVSFSPKTYSPKSVPHKSSSPKSVSLGTGSSHWGSPQQSSPNQSFSKSSVGLVSASPNGFFGSVSQLTLSLEELRVPSPPSMALTREDLKNQPPTVHLNVSAENMAYNGKNSSFQVLPDPRVESTFSNVVKSAKVPTFKLKTVFKSSTKSNNDDDSDQVSIRSVQSCQSNTSIRSTSSIDSLKNIFRCKKKSDSVPNIHMARNFASVRSPSGAYPNRHQRSLSTATVDSRSRKLNHSSSLACNTLEPPMPSVPNVARLDICKRPQQLEAPRNREARSASPPTNLSAGDISPGTLTACTTEELVCMLPRTNSKTSRRVPSLTRRTSDELVPNATEVEVAKELTMPIDSTQLPPPALKHNSGRSRLRKRSGASRSVQFASQILIYRTFSAEVYDRTLDWMTSDIIRDANVAQMVRKELNTLKSTMEVHPDSMGNTQFFQ